MDDKQINGISSLDKMLHKAEKRVSEYLTRYGANLPSLRIVYDPQLEEGTMATHRYPAIIVVREASVPESVIAHELVHIAQSTLEHFRGFRLLYELLSEGLAEWVAKTLYTEHEVKYRTGYRLIKLIVAADEKCISALLRLNELPLLPEDVDDILANPHLTASSHKILSAFAERIRDGIRTAIQDEITDPTFVTLGEEIKAWKFLLSHRFEGIRTDINKMVKEWFKLR